MSAAAPLRDDLRDGRVHDEARAWVIRLADEPEAEAACAEWRAADPAHEAAWREVSAVWNAAPSLGTLIGDDWRDEVERIGDSPFGRARHWALRGGGRVVLPLAMAASLVLAIVLPQRGAPAPLEVRTAIAETRVVPLEDGSRMTLGARSDAQVRFASTEREVVLESGQAFFEVAHDADRPFIVLAGNAEIRVTGTRFDVRRSGDNVQISVLEGRVEVRRRQVDAPRPAGSPAVVLTAGERSSLEGGQTFTPEQRAPVTPGEWRSGRLYYSEARVSDIVADVQRYSDRPIRLASAEVGAMRVTTSFRSDDIDQFIANLETALPIASRRAPDGAIILSAR